jgi:hypothetical protein
MKTPMLSLHIANLQIDKINFTLSIFPYQNAFVNNNKL